MPPPGEVALAVCFLPNDEGRRRGLEKGLEARIEDEGQIPLGWRDVPTDPERCGSTAREAMPVIRHLLIGRGPDTPDQDAFERKLFVIRRTTELRTTEIAFPSMSSRTVVYKGMLSAPQLSGFYADLRDPALRSALAIVHSRFSTNTFPSWALAHPHRMSAHNGEINTIAGNINWMQARESILESPLFGDDLERCLPLVAPGTSDSLAFDHVFELLCLAGRSLPHAAMMMIPRVHENRKGSVSPELEGFYNYHGRLIEPWDGPAAIVFTDGRLVGATLDRNGLRPGRWLITHDGWIAVSSEAGSFQVPEETDRRARAGWAPAACSASTSSAASCWTAAPPSARSPTPRPGASGTSERTVHIDDVPRDGIPPQREPEPDELRRAQLAFGYSQEDLRVVLSPMARDAKEPTGSMGNDVALALFSENAPSLFSYFKQRFAQVTNPAIDPVREYVVMSLRTGLGPEENLLERGALASPQLVLEQPVLSNEEAAVMRALDWGGLRAEVLDMTWPIADGPAGMEAAVERLCADAQEAIRGGANVIVLSDRALDEDRAAIPSLLATSAVHQHLVRSGDRVRTGLAVEIGRAARGPPRGGADRLRRQRGQPVRDARHRRRDGRPARARRPRLRRRPPARGAEALNTGLLKVHVEDGHLDDPVVQRGPDLRGRSGSTATSSTCHFTGTTSTIGGVGMEGLANEALARHARAYPQAHGLSRAGHVESALLPAAHEDLLPQGGVYAWRRDGERHMWDPETISSLQRAAQGNGDGRVHYAAFAERVNEENAQHGLIRGLLRMRKLGPPVPLDDVEPAAGDRQALLDRGDEPGRPLPGGARDPRDRDEPHRRPLELRRGRRGPAALHRASATATGAARRSSRSPPAASA